MLKVKRRFLFFGDYRLTELVCDACKKPIVADSELIGDIDVSSEFGAPTSRSHYHSCCVNRLSAQQKLMTHSCSFLASFVLDEWHRFLVATRADEELRVLHGFFLDSRSGLLKRIVQCGDCGLIAVLTMPPTKSEAHPEVTYYKWGFPSSTKVAPACSSNVERKLYWCGRPSPENCSHNFLRLGESGYGLADYIAIRKQIRVALDSGDIDPWDMQISRVNEDDLILGAFEAEMGFTWNWCCECGLYIRLINSEKSRLPVYGYAQGKNGSPSYAEGHTTQTRILGSPECHVA